MCTEVRFIERFAFRAVSQAATVTEVHDAHMILRLSKGLRKTLDLWRTDSGAFNP